MQLPITNLMRSTNGHGFGFRKPDGSMVYFEFETTETADAARKQIEVVISVARDITIHGR